MSITAQKLCHVYSAGTPFESAALKDVTLHIDDGEYVALIGHTGSGKTTLIQHLNGLEQATSGSLTVQGITPTDKKQLRALRRVVGLVFQYPEYQLFEETVRADIAFGAKNMGLEPDEVEARVNEAAQLVGLPPQCLEQSPFDLSGGQKRRAAIAGVLAMRPQVLVLDEPIAGLDPMGRRDILKLVDNYHSKTHATVILVSHNMDDVADIADRVIVMHSGTVAMDGTPAQVFSKQSELARLGMEAPQAVQLACELRRRGIDVPQNVISTAQMRDYLLLREGLL